MREMGSPNPATEEVLNISWKNLNYPKSVKIYLFSSLDVFFYTGSKRWPTWLSRTCVLESGAVPPVDQGTDIAFLFVIYFVIICLLNVEVYFK